MTLGTEDLVRQFGGAHDTTELPSAQITVYLEAGTRRVEDLTGREEADWATHPDKNLADMAASYFAAIHVVDRFASIDDADVASRRYARTATELCESINKGKSEVGSGGNPSIAVVTGSYRASRLNSSAVPFKSKY